MSTVTVTPLKANQVRAYKNKQGKVNFYIVLKPDNKPENTDLYTAWIRNEEGAPFHISSTFNMSPEHPLIMEDMNALSSVFTKIYKDNYDEDYKPPQ